MARAHIQCGTATPRKQSVHECLQHPSSALEILEDAVMFVFLEVLIQTLNFSDPWVRWVSWPKSGFLESLHLTVAVRLDFAQYVYILHFFSAWHRSMVA